MNLEKTPEVVSESYLMFNRKRTVIVTLKNEFFDEYFQID
jgi:hypothetical protein